MTKPTALLDEPWPPWATGKASGSYSEYGAQLCTKDGRNIGNALIVGMANRVIADRTMDVVEIITDIGTRLVLTPNELEELFHVPQWTMDVERFRAILAARKQC